MSASEFDIIRRYFTRSSCRADVVLGIGDDAAILKVPAGKLLAISIDTLVAGVHFPHTTSAQDIAWKSVAVNLSDLAAMGATPAWLTLALTLPTVDETWLADFANSFYQICDRYSISLVGGDTTYGPLAISVQAHGFIDAELAMRRDAAMPGDAIYVTGTLGDAALALCLLQSELLTEQPLDVAQYLLTRLNRPQPQVEFALRAARVARCAIDISDGLLADLGHITQASACGAEIMLDAIPLSEGLCALYREHDEQVNLESVLSGGDDYELCLAVNPQYENELMQMAMALNVRLTRIGMITVGEGVRCLDAQQREVRFSRRGYQHFLCAPHDKD